MSRQSGDLSPHSLRLVENPELSQHRAPVVIYPFPGKTIISVESVHTAERELDPPPSRQKTTPPTEMGSPDQDFHENGILRNVAALHLDF